MGKIQGSVDRIQINNVWYIREELIEEPIEVINSMQCMYEDGDYCFDATKFVNDDGEISLSGSVFIDFTDKRTEPWKKECWDNNLWMRGVYDKNLDSLKDAEASMCSKGISKFQKFIGILIEKNWL